jgi:hypothetical protein
MPCYQSYGCHQHCSMLLMQQICSHARHRAAVSICSWLSAFLLSLVFRLCVCVCCWLQYCSCYAARQGPGMAALGVQYVHVSRLWAQTGVFWRYFGALV